MTKTITPLILLASVACTLSAAPALAKMDAVPMTVTGPRSDDPDTLRVSYADLSLANAGDAAELRARVKREAHRICGALHSGALLQTEWTCRDVVWQAAAPQISAAIEQARSGQAMAATTVVVRFATR
jgi:UrcA family protein